MNAERDDQLPDDEQLRALYRRLPAEEPPAPLDDLILAAARRAAGSRPRPLVYRWRVPLAAAASLLLATLLLRQWSWQQQLPQTVGEPLTVAPTLQHAPSAAEPVRETVAPAVKAKAAGPVLAKTAAPAIPAASAAPATPPPTVSGLAENQPPARAEAKSVGSLRADDALSDSAAAYGAADIAPAPAAAAPTTVAGRPWPLGLLPTLAPDTACARLVQDSGGTCRGRALDGALELELRAFDPDWLSSLRASLAGLDWQEDNAGGDSVQYSRAAGAGRDIFVWRLHNGVLTLRLTPAAR